MTNVIYSKWSRFKTLHSSLRFDQWHSSLPFLSVAFHFIHLGHEYLAYIFHMRLVDGSCPEQEHADKFSTVSSHRRPLVSPDTAYEVNYTLSSLISAPRSRCLCPIYRSCRDPQLAGKARSLPRNALRSRPLRWWSLPPFIIICQKVAPFREIDTVLGHGERKPWLIFHRQTLRCIYRSLFSRWPDLSVRQ